MCDELTATTTTTAASPTGVRGTKLQARPTGWATRTQACVLHHDHGSVEPRGAAWIHTPLRSSHSGQPPPRAASHAQIARRAVVECNARCRADGAPGRPGRPLSGRLVLELMGLRSAASISMGLLCFSQQKNCLRCSMHARDMGNTIGMRTSAAQPSPEDLATLKISNSMPGKPRNSLDSWSWRGNFHRALGKATKKRHTPAASPKIPNSLAP